MSQVVSRFAPSPTGHLHLGGARTAVFSWLLARSAGGTFHLRIEDTDRERSTDEMTRGILEAMEWLGLDLDGDPVFQSKRFDLYDQHVERLLQEGKAYFCSCTPEEVEAMREKARAEGRKPKYDGTCRDKELGPGPDRVVRFKTPLTGRTVYEDMVKGPVAWENSELDDLVIRRPDGSPTYNLSVVVDDALMGVTHVLRGDDHVNNTPRQILMCQAMGYPVPEFGHVPMILGPDKKKLSKRHNAKSILEYRDAGYLPEAMLNYLVRLGWSHGDQELFSRDELLEKFSTRNLNRSAAAFDPDKLLWINHQYIQQADPAELARLLAGRLALLGRSNLDRAYVEAVVPQYQPRSQTMEDMARDSLFYFTDDDELEYDKKAVAKFLTPEAGELLAAIRDVLAGLGVFTREALEEAMRGFVEEREIKFKVVAQPMRVALTGKTASPGLFEMMEVMGRDRVLARLDRAAAL